ncbi:MAG: hypothetical protein QOI91_679 [Solirubrobacteraceae bacterium]|jgi:LPXTG-motif cell wall-anchored protein|nr:hypothetical protein [Solirubrobacteraceae bacterium]
MLSPRRLAALTAAATLAFPAGALAQGAGETQYSDPFQGQGGSGSSGSGSGSSSGSGSGSNASGTGSGSQLSTTPPGSAQTGATRTGTGQLPNTGAEPGLLALLGAGFILTGAGLRVRVRRSLA